MREPWPAIRYEAWRETCDTLHAHTQVLGKLAAGLAPPEPQLQHSALRLTARGWETLPLPAPNGSGALVVALDLHRHEAVAEHSDGRIERVPLTPDRSVRAVTADVLAAVRGIAGDDIAINPAPQEVPWTVALDADDEHATYNTGQVETYFAAATRAAQVLAAFRAPLGEYILEWDAVIAAPDPHAAALEFAQSAFRHSCVVCEWDHGLATSAEGDPPPVV